MTTIAAVTQQYDLAGNVTTAFSADRGTTYKYYYDHHNRLTEVKDGAGSVTQATFTWDALGRRIEFVNADFEQTTEYWYDGVKEIDEKTTQDGEIPSYTTRYYIHGVSYVDEHLLMQTSTKPYYYVLDRMYNP